MQIYNKCKEIVKWKMNYLNNAKSNLQLKLVPNQEEPKLTVIMIRNRISVGSSYID